MIPKCRSTIFKRSPAFTRVSEPAACVTFPLKSGTKVGKPNSGKKYHLVSIIVHDVHCDSPCILIVLIVLGSESFFVGNSKIDVYN